MNLRAILLAVLGLALLHLPLSSPVAAATKAQTQAKAAQTKAAQAKAAQAKAAQARKTPPRQAARDPRKPVARQAAASKAQTLQARRLATQQASKAATARRTAAAAAAASAAAAATAAPPAPLFDAQGNPVLDSEAYVVADQRSGEVMLSRNAAAVLPIASITKLMTAVVVLEAKQSLEQPITIEEADVDRLKGTSSRLSLGTTLTREEMLHLALMSSENRAASALGRHYPGGLEAFVSAMNAKARLLGLYDTRFSDPTGLNPANVSSPRDLARLVAHAANFPLIRKFSTADDHFITASNGKLLKYRNTNALVRSEDWSIGLSKTGFIREAGRCLVMQAWMQDRPIVIVLLDAGDRVARLGDAERIRAWVQSAASARLGPVQRSAS